MLRSILGTTLIIGTSVGAFCQTAAVPPAFEVASVRVSPSGKGGGERGPFDNIKVTPDTVTMRNVPLKSCIQWAYHVTEYQVSGPDWIQSGRYDIVGKAAGPVTEKQLRPMMQALLAERFKVELHHLTKELQAYVLQIGKNGVKFQESKTEGEVSIQPDQKRMSVSVQRAQMSQLVEGLSKVFLGPIIDQTGLTGRYDITINVEKYMTEMNDRAPGGDPRGDIMNLIVRGLQEELGLKLESRKTALDFLVIDRAEKVPVEN